MLRKHSVEPGLICAHKQTELKLFEEEVLNSSNPLSELCLMKRLTPSLWKRWFTARAEQVDSGRHMKD